MSHSFGAVPQPADVWDLSLAREEFSQLHPDASVGELLNFAYSACEGAFRPRQVKSEIERLLRVLEYNRPRTVVEIGTGNGGTLFLFARVARRDAIVVSVGVPNRTPNYDKSRQRLYRMFSGPEQQLSLVRCDSHESETLAVVLGLLRGRLIDLLFIDGDPTYEGVKLDFEMYSPFLSTTGLIGFHDIVPPKEQENWCEVARFWKELKERRPHSEIVENWHQGWAGIGLTDNREWNVPAL